MAAVAQPFTFVLESTVYYYSVASRLSFAKNSTIPI